MPKSTVVKIFVGSLIGAAASLSLLAWVGAVLNTAQLPDKTWFGVVLVGGLVSLGFLATLAYVIGGPADEQPVTDDPKHLLGSDTAVPAMDPDGQRSAALLP